MKKAITCISLSLLLFACGSSETKTTAESTTAAGEKSTVDLPYTAAYSSQWSTDVSDADLKTVLMSYKDWEDGNMSGLSKAMADTIVVDMSTGDHLTKSNADLMTLWTTYRDSLSSVKITMQGWHKMYSTDKKEGY